MADSGTTHVSMSKELKKLLKQYPNLAVMNEKPRVKCSLSGHEMPCQVEAIKNYITGKKFQKLLAQNQYNYDKFKEHIVPSTKKGREHQLFCLLTLRHINKNPEHIKRHIEGRRFKKAYARWEECQRTGEKFQPIGGKKKNYDMEEESNEDETGSDVDSLSDLYPAGNPEEEEEDRASDDLEEMEENKEEIDPAQNHTQGQKRKQAEEKKKKKNAKKKKS